MDYEEAVGFIEDSFISFQDAGRSAYRDGLEGISQMCAYLGDPQKNYLTVHVAGTNGKGSVSHIIASVLQAAGYRTGLFTSPHLNDFRERIRVDGEMISPKGVAGFVGEHGAKMRELRLSYFEMTASMAFEWFSQSDVEIAVIETGLGGRLDSTNIIMPVLSVITNIGMDHTDILGNTLAKIAYEKAGIIKREIPVVIGESCVETDRIFVEKASEERASLIFAEQKYECLEKEARGETDRYIIQNRKSGRMQTLDLDLRGDYQAKNLITAYAALSVLRRDTPVSVSTRALVTGCAAVAESTGLRGRWQTLSREPLIVCDAGHNPHAFGYIVEQLGRLRYAKLYMTLGFSSDKDISGILSSLPKEAYYIFTQASSSRAMPAEELAARAAEYGLMGETASTVAGAIETARSLTGPEDLIFIGGSAYVVAEAV